jgi:hypothetical protein
MAQGGAQIDATGLVLAGHSDLALYLSDAGTSAALTDLVVTGPVASVARLVSIQAEAEADLQRVALRGDALLGLYVGTGATVSASDLRIGATPRGESRRLAHGQPGGAGSSAGRRRVGHGAVGSSGAP